MWHTIKMELEERKHVINVLTGWWTHKRVNYLITYSLIEDKIILDVPSMGLTQEFYESDVLTVRKKAEEAIDKKVKQVS